MVESKRCFNLLLLNFDLNLNKARFEVFKLNSLSQFNKKKIRVLDDGIFELIPNLGKLNLRCTNFLFCEYKNLKIFDDKSEKAFLTKTLESTLTFLEFK